MSVTKTSFGLARKENSIVLELARTILLGIPDAMMSKLMSRSSIRSTGGFDKHVLSTTRDGTIVVP